MRHVRRVESRAPASGHQQQGVGGGDSRTPPVRHALLARHSVPKGTPRYVTDVIIVDPAGIAGGDGNPVASLIGKYTRPGAWDRTAAITLARDSTDARASPWSS